MTSGSFTMMSSNRIWQPLRLMLSPVSVRLKPPLWDSQSSLRVLFCGDMPGICLH